MDAGNLADAQKFADQAAEFDVAYGMFEDNPTLVSRDIKRLQGTGAAVNSTFASADSDTSEDAVMARKLLHEAREALVHGKLSVAREKAAQASELNVAYNVLDDRPELVLNDIELALRGQGKSQKSQRTDNVAASQKQRRNQRRISLWRMLGQL
jgi:hypothetical protein